RELVRIDDVPIPDVGAGEVMIRVLRAGLNHGDLHMREDAVQYSPEVKTVPDLPMTIGHDGLGEIVEVGPDVENLRVGDRVVVIYGASGITGIGTVLSALAMGAPLIIAVARNPARLERVRAIDPKRIATVALGRGESITAKVKELTNGQGASVLAELAPGGIE